MAKFRETCPNCYMNKGYSIPLESRDGKWHCGECGQDYIIGSDGYFKRV